MTEAETRDQDLDLRRAARSGPVPGIVHVYSTHGATSAAIQVTRRPLVIGRSAKANVTIDDDLLSREHVEVGFDGAHWIVRDFGSRNGTYVDGKKLQGVASFDHPQVLRMGSSIFLFDQNVGDFAGGAVTVEAGRVIGPRTQHPLEEIGEAAQQGKALLITGETGVGKEFAAQRFHKRSPTARGKLVAVNCAELPATLAEALLFGARKGAFSGADRDMEGYFLAANGGTLFLDEIGELDLGIQAKLLRVLETKRVARLGETEPRALNFHFCCATNRDLREEVRAGRFRQDLRFRIAQAEVRLLPLRERAEEITFFVEMFLTKKAPPLDVRFVEACLRRHWEGNVRDLRNEVEQAEAKARKEKADRIGPEHLRPEAPPAVTQPSLAARAKAWAGFSRRVTDVELREAWEELRSATAVARAIGMSRSQVYERLKKLGLLGREEASTGDAAKDDGDTVR